MPRLNPPTLGSTHGLLTVVALAGRDRQRRLYVLADCACGNLAVRVRFHHLVTAKAVSCGCVKKERFLAHKASVGHCISPDLARRLWARRKQPDGQLAQEFEADLRHIKPQHRKLAVQSAIQRVQAQFVAVTGFHSTKEVCDLLQRDLDGSRLATERSALPEHSGERDLAWLESADFNSYGHYRPSVYQPKKVTPPAVLISRRIKAQLSWLWTAQGYYSNLLAKLADAILNLANQTIKARKSYQNKIISGKLTPVSFVDEESTYYCSLSTEERWAAISRHRGPPPCPLTDDQIARILKQAQESDHAQEVS